LRFKLPRTCDLENASIYHYNRTSGGWDNLGGTYLPYPTFVVSLSTTNLGSFAVLGRPVSKDGARIANWISPQGSVWELPLNWSSNAPPRAQSAVFITNAETKTILISSNTAAECPQTLVVSNLTLSAPPLSTNSLVIEEVDLGAPLHVLDQLKFWNNSELLINHSTVQVDGLLQLAPVVGANNSIVIMNGGRLVSTESEVGSTSFGNNDSVLVTGTDSIWTNSGRIFVSLTYPGTGVTVAQGGQLVAGSHVYVGHGGNSGGTKALVTGLGSAWTNYGALFVGSFSPDIQFVVNQGAKAFSHYAFIGNLTASNQTVLVTGPDSVWASDGTVQVGTDISGPGVGLSVRDGAAVVVANASGSAVMNIKHGSLSLSGGSLRADQLMVGDCTHNVLGTVTMFNSTMSVTNATHTAVLDVRGGTFMQTGGSLVVDKLILTNNCGHFTRQGGTLSYRQLLIDPSMDTDGDGQSNRDESLSGTDPLSASSVFRVLSAVKTGNDIRVTWTTVGGHRYSVQVSTNLSGIPAHFADISGVIDVGGQDEGTYTYRDIGAAANPRRYYRVQLLP
jgi:T5SS/PEP-CTERM-associated repeat protein